MDSYIATNSRSGYSVGGNMTLSGIYGLLNDEKKIQGDTVNLERITGIAEFSNITVDKDTKLKDLDDFNLISYNGVKIMPQGDR